ncbi:hypothetical protein ABIA33_006862 [Streptacidiphilus sp. MAP12-16]|uniref:hypothetical protein n=1 Tax=Streptacidiphilus sp. MAP12-16 TaxID=3156300 RepID=UPI003513D777
MPSVIALLEVREARAREDLESWLEMLREAEVEAEAARQRLEHVRIAREEVALMFAQGAMPVREGDGPSPALAVVEEPVCMAGRCRRVRCCGRAMTPGRRLGRRGWGPMC